MHNTRHRTNSNFHTPLFNHSKTQKCYLCLLIPIWNSLPNSHKNCTCKFILKKQIKSHLLASQYLHFFNSIGIYFSLSSSPNSCIMSCGNKIVSIVSKLFQIVSTILEFFLVRLEMLPCGLWA